MQKSFNAYGASSFLNPLVRIHSPKCPIMTESLWGLIVWLLLTADHQTYAISLVYATSKEGEGQYQNTWSGKYCPSPFIFWSVEYWPMLRIGVLHPPKNKKQIHLWVFFHLISFILECLLWLYELGNSYIVRPPFK